MKKSKFTNEQIAFALKQAETGTPVAEICRKMGVSEPTFYRWKRSYGDLGVPELRELRQLRNENQRLKQLVADLSLDKHILQEIVSKNEPYYCSGIKIKNKSQQGEYKLIGDINTMVFIEPDSDLLGSISVHDRIGLKILKGFLSFLTIMADAIPD